MSECYVQMGLYRELPGASVIIYSTIYIHGAPRSITLHSYVVGIQPDTINTYTNIASEKIPSEEPETGVQRIVTFCGLRLFGLNRHGYPLLERSQRLGWGRTEQCRERELVSPVLFLQSLPRQSLDLSTTLMIGPITRIPIDLMVLLK